jgi:hypothetical protein
MKLVDVSEQGRRKGQLSPRKLSRHEIDLDDPGFVGLQPDPHAADIEIDDVPATGEPDRPRNGCFEYKMCSWFDVTERYSDAHTTYGLRTNHDRC